MQAFILAAGIGKRLGELTKDIPKCLLELDKNMAIIDFQIKGLVKAGLNPSKIFVVAGHKWEKLSYLKQQGINLIINPRYKEWNNIYSFLIIKDYAKEDFLLLNGDTIFHPRILKDLFVKGTYFVIDNTKQLGEEEMKTIIANNIIQKFGKDIAPQEAKGEYIGVAKFSINEAEVIFNKMKELISQGKTNIWYELAINDVLKDIEAKPLFLNELPWTEVDTPEDYKKAKLIFSQNLKNEI